MLMPIQFEIKPPDIEWSPVPGRLFASILCRWFGHKPALGSVDYMMRWITSHYQCSRCKRRGWAHHFPEKELS